MGRESTDPRLLTNVFLLKILKTHSTESLKAESCITCFFLEPLALVRQPLPRHFVNELGSGLDANQRLGRKSGIDVLRNKIKQFASTVSLTGGIKVIILDEADYLNAQSTQPALRGFIEEFSNNCRFILTCNFKNRLIEPLHSRCSVIEFNTNKKELAGLAHTFMGRLKRILDAEGVTYNEKVIAELIIRHAPDWRRVIGECQRYGSSGEIPAAILIGNSDESIAEVVTHLKDKDFKSMRAWVANNASQDTTAIFRKIYDSLSEHADGAGIPSAVLILADYQHRAAFVADKELNMVACLTELMANVTWKK